MTPLAPPPIRRVVALHVENIDTLRSLRTHVVRSNRGGLNALSRLDERLEANVDGLLVAGECGREFCDEALATPTRGSVFAAAVLALSRHDDALLDRLMSIAALDAAAHAGLRSAFGWVSPGVLRGTIRDLLDASDPWRRDLGLAACGMHGASPGRVLGDAIAAGDAGDATGRAATVAARLGRVDLLEPCLRALEAVDPAARFAVARAAVLLGDRGTALVALKELTRRDGPHRGSAIVLLAMALDVGAANPFIRDLARDRLPERLLIDAIGAAGDPQYVSWLIERMADPLLARAAGEAWVRISGVDLNRHGLDRVPDAEPDIAIDEDEGLAWPDPAATAAWWAANGARFVPGMRYFMGVPVSASHARQILETGSQPQRRTAAMHIALSRPGMSLFDVAAPAWRQLRALRSKAAA